MGADLTYTLTVRVPDKIDGMLWQEIEDDASPHDDTDGKMIARWLGGPLEDLRYSLLETLGDGWHVSLAGPAECIGDELQARADALYTGDRAEELNRGGSA